MDSGLQSAEVMPGTAREKVFLTTLVAAVFVLITTYSWSQQVASSLKPTTVLKGKAEMLIPSTFTMMNSETIARKYPVAGHRPSEVYSNFNGSINIALNHTNNAVKESDLTAIKEQMEAQFNRPGIDFKKSQMQTLNGKKFVILEFISPAADTKIYNLMAITSLEGRLAIITFNCTANYTNEWKPIGAKIIESVRL